MNEDFIELRLCFGIEWQQLLYVFNYDFQTYHDTQRG